MVDGRIEEFSRVWSSLLLIESNINIASISTRYINDIRLPIKSNDLVLSDYSNLSPNSPNYQGNENTSFLIQLNILNQTRNTSSTIIETIQKHETPNEIG
jgi:hypothetical protein